LDEQVLNALMRRSGATPVLLRISASFGGALQALLERALARAGAVPAGCSHLVLAVNAPGAAQAHSHDQPHRDVETHGRDLEAFAETLRRDAAAGRTIALADI